MTFKLTSCVLVLLAYQTVLGSADDEYFKKAVFPALKAQDGQFSSHVKFVRLFPNDRIQKYIKEVEEKHSFKLNTGNVKERKFYYYTGANKFDDSEEVIYINGTEFYSAYDGIGGIGDCFSWRFHKLTVKNEARGWMPRFAIFSQECPYKTLGEFFFLNSNPDFQKLSMVSS